MEEEEIQKATRLGTMLMLSVSCMVAFAGISEFLAYLSGTSYCYIPQSIYGIFHETREVSELVTRARPGEYYEHETEFVFSNKTGREGAVNFTLLWDVVDGFDENAVVFDAPNISYRVGPAGAAGARADRETEPGSIRGETEGEDADKAGAEKVGAEKEDAEKVGAEGKGWRRLTIRCRDFDPSGTLTALLRYPADKIAVRDTAPGYYRWDLDLHIKEDIPELDQTMASFENPYACANWIKRNIRYKSLSREPQTAAETFRAGEGDCDDIALLFCYMVKRLFPERTPRVVEGWTVDGGYHANVAMRADDEWLTFDPAMSSVRFGVFDLKPFVPSGRVSPPLYITDAKGNAVEDGDIDVIFGAGTVRRS
jgi:hypothetical protein